MAMFEKVTDLKEKHDFCLTDCGPSEGCNPDEWCSPDDKDKIKINED